MRNKILGSEKFFLAGFWTITFFVVFLQVIPQTENLLQSFLFSFLFIATVYFPSDYLSRNLLLKAMRTKVVKPFAVQFAVCSLFVGVAFAGYLYLFYYLEMEGIFPKSKYFDMEGVPLYSVSILFASGVFINISICGLRFLLEYVKSQKIILEYQLRTLQHQITPHFMFNVLNHIHILMQSDVELASSLLIKYSEILRYQLYKGEKELISLKEEMQFLKDFIAVEELRWDDKLTVVTKWNVENENVEIPSLLFITFVENAFKHVSKTNLEKGFIHISFEQKDKVIRFDIKNSKSLIEIKKDHHGLGLRNVKERLEILYHGRYELRIEETDSVFDVSLMLNL